VTRYGALDGREERGEGCGEGDSDLRAVRPDDGRDNGSPLLPVPGSERGAKAGPHNSLVDGKRLAGQKPLGAAAMRRGTPSRNHL
jgi:hypothetical protein